MYPLCLRGNYYINSEIQVGGLSKSGEQNRKDLCRSMGTLDQKEKMEYKRVHLNLRTEMSHSQEDSEIPGA